MKFDMKECYDRLDQRALNQALAGLFKGEDDSTAYYVREYATLDELFKLKKQRNAIETEVHNFSILSEEERPLDHREPKRIESRLRRPEAFEKVQEKVSSGELQKYGAYVNNDKTVLINGKESTQSKLSFVGLDINTTSLEVKKDSSQFGRPAFKFRSFKALFTHLKQYYCTNLSDFLLDSSSNLLETVIVNVRTVLMLMFEAIKASFVSMCKLDTFHCYRFIKFLNNIFEITLDRFIKVNGSSEGMEELLACIKVTATRALAFMKDKQEIIEWIYTLEL
ncbi:hypothetical protein Cantr_05742 [Candida viswanathii]|uniref:Telomerase reverse transcriptase n=1 Tax=Candida viswanathii TaxID=5486 RepID=A0A367XQK7_9ASCO|nr:hypothetical protein Cantr_05742 [Candida viswanathii]